MSAQRGDAHNALAGWRLANDLEALGHLDVDYRANFWSVSRPAVCLLPGTSLCAAIVGSRTHYFLEHLGNVIDDSQDLFPFEIENATGPRSLFLKAPESSHLEDAAKRLDAAYLIDPAASIASILPSIGSALRPAAAPHPDAELERLDPESIEWKPVHQPAEPGLYRWEHQRLSSHRLLDANLGWQMADDLGYLYFAALNQAERAVLSWKAATTNFDAPDRLVVTKRVPLPSLASRAAVASSALLPHVTETSRVYRNVRREIADHIARQLGQDLDPPA